MVTTAERDAPSLVPKGSGSRLVMRYFAPGEAVSTIVGAVTVIAACIGFFIFASETNADTWVPVLVLVNLIVIGYLICRWLAGTPRDSRLFKLLICAFLLKMACTAPRYYLNEGVYKGNTDAFNYDKAGVLFVDNVRHGHWSIEGSEVNAFPLETRSLGYMVGCLFLVFGTSYFGAYLVFALVSWIGLVCFYRAFRIAYPNAPPYLPAALLFYLPATLFWPSSPGKEGVMIFFLGLLTLGFARLLARANMFLGAIEAVAGGALCMLVRPHLMVICGVAFAASLLSVGEQRMIDTRRASKLRGAGFRILMAVLIVPVLVSGLGRMDSLLGTSGGGSQSISDQLNETIARTEIGGSAFHTTAVRTPLDLPAGIITVFYRPFPFEARNVPALIASAEGMLLLVLTVTGVRWVWRVGPAMYRNQFAAYCGVYVLGFVVAFSNIGNAGILSRQRSQMLPLLMLLACAAKEHERIHTPPDPDEIIEVSGTPVLAL